MAEAAGLAVGAVALAGLFTTCVDCFEKIELGRNFARDAILVNTSFEAQWVRLVIWGQAVGLVGDIPYDTGLDNTRVRGTIERSLLALRMLFDDGESMSRTYGLRPIAPDSRLGQVRVFGEIYTRFRERVLASQRQSQFRTKAAWAIRDREKFTQLVQEIKNIIDTLESITNLIGKLREQQQTLLTTEIATIRDESRLELIRDATSDTAEKVSETASIRLSLLQRIPGAYPHSVRSEDTASIKGRINEQGLDSEMLTGGTSLQERLQTLSLEPAVSTIAQNRRVMNAVGPFQSHAIASAGVAFASNPVKARPEPGFSMDEGKVSKLNQSTSSTSLNRRIIKQIGGAMDWDPSIIGLTTIEDSLIDLLAYVRGAVDTPYQDGIFYIRLHIPREYPFRPPICKFLTRIYHPNIDSRGRICLDQLYSNWSPVTTLASLIATIQQLLGSPQSDDPLVPEIAEQYIRDRSEFERIARTYTERYATGTVPELPPDKPNESTWYADMKIER